MRHIEKIIFDLDGTLYNTQHIYAEVESSLLAQKGISLSPEEITRRYAGTHTRKYFESLLGSAALADELLLQKREMILVRSPEITPLYPATFFDELLARGYRLSIGTGSSHRTVDPILSRFCITHLFDSIVCGDDVREGKPHPETWERAAGDTAPSACLVVEDGLAGTEAAVSAGMHVALLLPCEHPSATRLASLNELLLIV